MAEQLRADPYNVALRSKMYQKVYHVNDLALTSKKLDLLKNTIAKISDKIHTLFKNVPNSPTHVTKVTKITGKLFGGFGVFIELLGLYDDAKVAMEDFKTWYKLLCLIEYKIPCPENPEKAIGIRNDIRVDAIGLAACHISTLKAEWQATVIDFASLFVEGVPVAELCAWFASGTL